MLFVRLKQCEVALNAGRLDEAFDLLRSPDLRSHRKGQDLVDRLAKAMLDRGRAHLAAGQLEAAAADCERAARTAGNLPDVLALRTAVSEAMAERRRADQRRDQLATAVRRHMDQGQLTLGGQLLAAAPADVQTQRIGSELAARRATIQAVAKKVGAAIGAGDWEAALDQLAQVDRQVTRHPDVRELCGRVTASVVAEATRAIESGSLDRAGALLQRHQELPGRFIDADRLREALRQCREAAACVERSDTAGAERNLRGLSAQWPNASWVSDALRHVQQIRTSAEAVLAGPLGMIGAASPLPGPPPEYRGSERADDDGDFVLHVDGAGGFRVMGGQSVTFGPASSSRNVDVAVTGDASVPVVTISRSDEDYFVQSRQPVEVNGSPTTHALLAPGDTIAVGPRCRLRLRRPNPASTSVVLDVTAGRLARGDVRQVILFDRELIVGPGPAAHVRVDALSGPAVFQRRRDGLVCRAADPVLLDGRPAGTEPLITPGVHVTIGPVGLILVREEGG
ncbi:MAG TPA: hypothetical protein VGI81_24370 [Tepidisphaeraceae bacterium]